MMRRMLVLAALAASAAGCRAKDGGEDAAGRTVSVHTAVATARAFPQSASAIGTVSPRPGRFAELSAPAATRVARIFVAPGDRVRAGDTLVEFERAPFEAAARGGEAALAAAQANHDRAVRLAQAGVLPRKDVDQSASELAQAQTAAVTARRALELATLLAPIGGVVTRMTAVLGQPVDASQTLVEVVDPDALDIVLSLSAEAAARVRAGAEVVLTTGADAHGEPLGNGAVAGVAAAVDSVARVVQVRVRLTHPARALRVGETVVGRITTGVHQGAVTIPAEALVPDGEGFKVFVVDAAGLARARAVTVGSRADSLVEIVRGLAAGETVVTYGAYGMEDSTRVVRVGP
jgi:membrane fusion protein (multidrug efflux system)